jgi:hypothetical protein
LESAHDGSTDGKPIFVHQLSVHVDVCEGLATCVQKLDWTTGSAVWCCATFTGRVSDGEHHASLYHCTQLLHRINRTAKQVQLHHTTGCISNAFCPARPTSLQHTTRRPLSHTALGCCQSNNYPPTVALPAQLPSAQGTSCVNNFDGDRDSADFEAHSAARCPWLGPSWQNASNRHDG